MMNIFLAGTAVAVTIPLVDAGGNTIEASAVEYRIVNHDGMEILARAALASFGGGTEVTVEVPAGLNEVATVDPSTITAAQVDSVFVREGRTVELFVTDAIGNTIFLSATYILEPNSSLVVGLNTFQNLALAGVVALDMPALNGWSGATEKQKVAALVEARIRICQLRFSILNSNVNWGQDNLNYVPEGSYPTPYAGAFMFNGNLALITPSNFGKLPNRFRLALCRAQLAEADAILGGDPADVRRQEGLVLETVGEVKQMFRSGKPLDLPVSKRALRYLSPFVSFAKVIGRG